jgi:hypothetical protein
MTSTAIEREEGEGVDGALLWREALAWMLGGMAILSITLLSHALGRWLATRTGS